MGYEQELKEHVRDVKQRLYNPENAYVPPPFPEARPYYYTYQNINRDAPWVAAMKKDKIIKRLTFDAILKAVCKHFDVRKAEIIGPRRSKSIVLPRQLAMHICWRELNDCSLPLIGRRFNRDHTTVLYATRKIEDKLLDDPILRIVRAEIISVARTMA